MPEQEERTVEEKQGDNVVIERVSAGATAKVTLIVLAVIFVVYLIQDLVEALGFLFFLIIVSIFFAYLLEPLVRLIQRPFVVRNLDRLMPRPVAIVVSYIVVFSFLGVAISYLAPQVASQITDFLRDFPNYVAEVQTRINAINDRYSELMITEDAQKAINEYFASSARNLTDTLTSTIGSAAVSILTYLPWMLVIPVFAFFFLKDAIVLRNLFLACFPSGRWRARADSLLFDVNKTIAAYTRAQLISCILIGSICTIGFTLIGLNYPLLLGLLAGVLEFVPLLGPVTVAITATLIAAFSDDPWQAAWTAGFLIILRLIHDYVTYPRIVRDGVHLHPFAVILSVLAGEQIAGIPGVFLSIPVVALITVFHKHILEHSGRTGIFAEIFKNREEVAEASTEE
ncbi:MAG: AI-2E family transporter [Acidobacteriota bacterium]|nr:AI-2E family transporter [Acidobacteriota bacterium]MDH3530042.1 AI-2E family transporter [Acidobacteriota bacterium]